MAEWLVSHVLTVEDRLERLTSDAYTAALKNAWWDKLITVRPGTGRKQLYEWLLTTAQIHDLPRGQMRFDDLVTQAHEVLHNDRGVGLRVTQNQWEDDAFAFAGDWATQMGGAMAMDPQYAAVKLISQGTTQKGYDGVPFFSATHPIHPQDSSVGTYRNLVTDVTQLDATLSSAAPALSPTNYALGVALMKSHKMPNGNNRNLRPTYLFTGPKQEKPALEVTSAGFIGATENVLKGYRVEPIVINEITDNSWGLAAEDGETPGLRMLVRSERRAYQMTSYNGLTQVALNRIRELEWHVLGRYGHTYGHPYQGMYFQVP